MPELAVVYYCRQPWHMEHDMLACLVGQARPRPPERTAFLINSLSKKKYFLNEESRHS